MEDTSEAESRGVPDSSAPTSPPIKEEPKKGAIAEFPLTLLQTQPACDVYPDLHKIIQVVSEGGSRTLQFLKADSWTRKLTALNNYHFNFKLLSG